MFWTIVCAFVVKSDLSHEDKFFRQPFYDWCLVISFVVCILVAFILNTFEVVTPLLRSRRAKSSHEKTTKAEFTRQKLAHMVTRGAKGYPAGFSRCRRGFRVPTSRRACLRGAEASRTRHPTGPSIPAATLSTCRSTPAFKSCARGKDSQMRRTKSHYPVS